MTRKDKWTLALAIILGAELMYAIGCVSGWKGKTYYYTKLDNARNGVHQKSMHIIDPDREDAIAGFNDMPPIKVVRHKVTVPSLDKYYKTRS